MSDPYNPIPEFARLQSLAAAQDVELSALRAQLADRTREVEGLQRALSQALLYLPDANNQEALDVVGWHHVYRGLILAAAEATGRSHLLVEIGARAALGAKP